MPGGYRANPPNLSSHTRNTRTGYFSPSRPRYWRARPGRRLGLGELRLDNNGDDHRAAAVGGVDPFAHHPAHPLLEIVHILNAVG